MLELCGQLHRYLNFLVANVKSEKDLANSWSVR